MREGTMDFVRVVPRIALGVVGSGYIASVIPQEIITGWLGPDSGWSGGGAPQVVAYVLARALFAFQRLILWEIPFMPARFVWFRAAVSLPFPFLPPPSPC